jgi:hypothetical protein
MPNFLGKKGVIDEAEVFVNPKTSNVISGFTSEDFVYVDFDWTSSQTNRYFGNVLKQGADLLITTNSVRTGKTVATTTIKGAYAADGSGIEFLEIGIMEDDGLYSDSLAIAKYGQFKVSANAAQQELNWHRFLVVGGNASEKLYGADTTDNAFFDNAGDDQMYGGSGTNEFNFGSGNDAATGGDGGNYFKFGSLLCFVNGKQIYTKTIANFRSGDSIDLTSVGDAYKMQFNATATASNWKRGDLIFEISGNDGWLLGNTDRDKDAEIKIVLTGVTSFSAADNLDLN